MTNDSFIASFRNSQGTHRKHGNLFYEGNYLYSYGRHFPLMKKFGIYYLFNHTHYSSTTQRHQSAVLSLYRNQLIHTPGCDMDNFHPYHMGMIKDQLDKLKRCRKVISYMEGLEILLHDYQVQSNMAGLAPEISYNGNLSEWVIKQDPSLKAKLVKFNLEGR